MGTQKTGAPAAPGQVVIRMADDRQEFVKDVDGFVYWRPACEHGGHLAGYQLRILADELDRRNKAWEEEIDRYFAQGGGDPKSCETAAGWMQNDANKELHDPKQDQT